MKPPLKVFFNASDLISHKIETYQRVIWERVNICWLDFHNALRKTYNVLLLASVPALNRRLNPGYLPSQNATISTPPDAAGTALSATDFPWKGTFATAVGTIARSGRKLQWRFKLSDRRALTSGDSIGVPWNFIIRKLLGEDDSIPILNCDFGIYEWNTLNTN